MMKKAKLKQLQIESVTRLKMEKGVAIDADRWRLLKVDDMVLIKVVTSKHVHCREKEKK